MFLLTCFDSVSVNRSRVLTVSLYVINLMHIERSSNKSYPVLKLPPPAPPYTGGELITKRFLPLCKGELVGVVFQNRFFEQPQFIKNSKFLSPNNNTSKLIYQIKHDIFIFEYAIIKNSLLLRPLKQTKKLVICTENFKTF